MSARAREVGQASAGLKLAARTCRWQGMAGVPERASALVVEDDPQIARLLREIVVLTAGWGPEPAARARAMSTAPVISKPFDIATVRDAAEAARTGGRAAPLHAARARERLPVTHRPRWVQTRSSGNPG